MSEQQAEADLLALATEQFAEEGYTVVREPGASSLPAPLRDLHPDAIAIGKRPFVVIEVVREGAQNAERVIRLQRAAQEAGDWNLHLILDRGERKPGLDQIPAQIISSTLNQARKLLEVDTRAALLLSWASFEAVARAMAPTRFAKPQSPGRIIESMASEGIVTPSEASALRKLATSRNAVVHGDLRVAPPTNELEKFLRVQERLLKRVDRSPPPGSIAGSA
jgi:uncharacterized protein YutE (UPF0331/DUF86 family)